MDPKVKEFLAATKVKEKKVRDEHLISLGLAKREYSDKYDDNHPQYDYAKKQYFCESPIDITDEEYEEIKKSLRNLTMKFE